MLTDRPHLQQQFTDLLKAHERIVYHVARLYAAPGDDRHDLVQEICSQLWQSFPRYDPARSFSTWMYRVALNVGISHLRDARARQDRFEFWDDERLEAVADGAAAQGQDERLQELDGLIRALDPLNRALVLLYLDERPYAEIADVLGITETNVATKISRIKQRLREQLSPSTPTEKPHGTR